MDKNTSPMYRVTKQFVSGHLKGIVITETTSVEFQVGKKYKPCAGCSSYIVTSQTQIQ